MVKIKKFKFVNGKVRWLGSAFISTGFALFGSLDLDPIPHKYVDLWMC